MVDQGRRRTHGSSGRDGAVLEEPVENGAIVANVDCAWWVTRRGGVGKDGKKLGSRKKHGEVSHDTVPPPRSALRCRAPCPDYSTPLQ